MSGRVMFRPNPLLIAEPNDQEKDSHPEYHVLQIEPDLPGEWIAIDDARPLQSAIPLKIGEAKPGYEKHLGSLVLPFLEGLTFAQLANVLDGEEDCLAEFRTSIKKLLAEVQKDPAESKDILNDIVRPATDKVERRLKAVSRIHGLRLAGVTISTAALSLAALTSTGIGAGLATIFGASGISLMAKEYSDYLKAKEELKEMPFYLLWRLGRADRK